MRILLAACDAGLRELIDTVVQSVPETELVAIAETISDAVRSTKRLTPDIVLVGLRLRDGPGLDAVSEIMIEAPVPTVVLSHDNISDLGPLTARALEAGALAVVPAPVMERGRLEPLSARKFLATMAAMAQVKVVRRWRAREPAGKSQGAAAVERRDLRIVGIVASTGGPSALMTILSRIAPTFPAPILVVQHISAGFIEGVAAHLNDAVPLSVVVAGDGMLLKSGTAYLAPDGMQLGVADRSRIKVADAPPVNGFRPPGTYLFGSIARVFGVNALALVLTGMGNDGVEGLRLIRKAGGTVIAQDEQSSVVFGMPAAAAMAGLVDRVLPLNSIADEISAMVGCSE